MATSYSPVPYFFRELLEEQITTERSGKIFFFDANNKVDSFEGRIVKLGQIPQEGMFIYLLPENMVRIDRIITLFGKPGPAVDEYDDFANQCLSCTGGYEL